MTSYQSTISDETAVDSSVCRRLVRAIDEKRSVIVGSWPAQARRSLTAAGCDGDIACVIRLTGEAETLLADVSRNLTKETEDPDRRDANASYDLLSGEIIEEAASPAESAALLQLHRSLIHSVWALVLPEIAGELSAEEIAIAHDALVRATRESLGMHS